MRPESTPVIGESPAFIATLEHASRVAALARPVLVIGERGTGKELIAARLHFLSPRWGQPFIKLNCAALTETLLESELFGHEAGAFTGATRRHVGRFELADGGTLFLDELASVPIRMQEKILRVIEYGEFERVGGSETVRVDVRIVGATNRDLPAMARRGTFRPDLLDRLAFDVITVPPLRARSEDILLLAQHFAIEMTGELGGAYFAGFTEEAAGELLDHAWPGNVRELKNVVERSVYAAEPETPVESLVLDPFSSPWRPEETARPEFGHRGSDFSREPSDADEATGGIGTHPAHEQGPTLPMDLEDAVAAFETEAIRRALAESRYNQRAAAGLLGLSYHQLRGRLRKYGIETG